MEELRDIEISEIRRLTETIKNKYGYDFSEYALSSFKRRVGRIMSIHNFKSIDNLVTKLILDKHYFQTFLSELTVNVTEMFRDPTFWISLRNDTLPNLFKNKDKVRIWHAGCSSGEEVLSMTILLKEMGVLNRANIIASDIDQKILNKARKASYTLKNMEVNDQNYDRANGNYNLAKYYTKEGNNTIFDEDLLANVLFKEYNLVSSQSFSKFDLILCRNVLIYFNQSLQNKVLKNIHESLYLGGYLAIGSKESLIWCDAINKFNCINKEEKIYKKVKE